jgi:translation initiation factor 1A
MGKKNTGGKIFKKQKKESTGGRELVFKEADQEYARITKCLGDSRFECECLELNQTKIAHLRGVFKKRVWMGVGDIILVSIRDFDPAKCDIIHKYTQDEAYLLKSYGEIPSNINLQATKLDISNGNANGEDDLEFDFKDI